MSNHIQLIIGRNGMPSLEAIIRDMKKFTSSRIVDTFKNNDQESRHQWLLWFFERAGRKNSNNTNFQFWQQHNHPVELNANEALNWTPGNHMPL